MSEQKMREALIAMLSHSVSFNREGDKARIKAQSALFQPAGDGLTDDELRRITGYGAQADMVFSICKKALAAHEAKKAGGV